VSAIGAGGQAFARGVEKLGAGIENSAENIAAAYTARVKSDAILAQDVALGKGIGLRQKYKDRTDYQSFPGEHAAELDKITSEAVAGLPDGPIKQHVQARLQIPFAHEKAAVAEQARNIENQTFGAYRRSDADFIVNAAAQTGSNDPMVTEKIRNHLNRIDDDASHGRVGPLEARLEKERLATRVAEATAANGINSGDAIGVLNEFRSAPTNDDQVTDRILQIEGASKNPHSSATGTGQFIDSTWLDMIKRHRPDLAAGRSDADILAMRADRALGREMTGAYAKDNAAVLRGQGIEPTPGNTYLAHFLGPAGAAAVAKADPNRPVIDVLSEAVGPERARRMIEANRGVLQGKLAGSVTQWSNGLMGGRPAGSQSIFDMVSPEGQSRIRQAAETALANRANRNDAEAKLDEYNLKSAIVSDITSMQASGRGIDNPPNDQVRRVLGEAAFQQWQDQRTDAHDLWTATHDFQTLPEATIQSRLVAIAPQPGAPDFARKQAIVDAAQKYAADVLKQRRDDPAGSISGDPTVRDAQASYDPNNPETFRPVAAARMAAQERAGLDPEYRSPISKHEALQLTAPLRTMLPGQERQVLTELGERFQKMFGEDADTAFAYALRAHKVDAATSQLAARVMRKLQLGQMPTEDEARQLDQTAEVDAAERAVNGGRTGALPAAEAMQAGPAPFVASDYANVTRETAGNVPMPERRVEPQGPNLPAIKPRAIEFLLKHPETAAAFDKEYGRRGLAKEILERYSTAAKPPGTRKKERTLSDLITEAP
jgi:hypothetical protein